MIPSRLQVIPKPTQNKRNTAQPAENALRTSPVFQRVALDAAQKFFVFTVPGQISALVLAELRCRWPKVTAADVDYALAASALAFRSEAACYREAMLSGLKMGERAAAETRSEARLRRAA